MLNLKAFVPALLAVLPVAGVLGIACSAADDAAGEASSEQPFTSTVSELLIQDGKGGGAAVARSFDLLIGKDIGTSKGNCSATSRDGNAGTLGTDRMPAAGSAVSFTNTSSEPVLLRAFQTNNTGAAGGGSVTNEWPTFGPGLHLPTSPEVPANMAGTIVELAAGASVEAIVPSVPEGQGKVSTAFWFQCQRLSTFAKRPKFSYGWMYFFSTFVACRPEGNACLPTETCTDVGDGFFGTTAGRCVKN